LSKDLNFGGHPLKAGKYSMYAIPRKDIWTIGVNSVANRWGYAEPDYDKDVLTITSPVNYTEEITEMFTISFEESDKSTELVFKWDTSEVRITLQ